MNHFQLSMSALPDFMTGYTVLTNNACYSPLPLDLI